MAAESGAKKVWAVEVNAEAAAAARELVRSRGFEDTIEVIHGQPREPG